VYRSPQPGGATQPEEIPMTHPTSSFQPQLDDIHGEVQRTYEQVAGDPRGEFHFHRGPAYAARQLGYDAAELAELPALSTAPFAGVGNPLAIAPLEPGAVVLDLGCGAGMDLLLAARRVGPRGRAIGVDMTAAMRERARSGAAAAGLADRIEVRAGFLEDLPVADASVDVIISNGVLNLVPDKRRAFGEIRRVLRPGGRLQLADVVVARPVKADARDQAALWAACIAGALSEGELHALAAEVGLRDGTIVAWFDAYAGTSAEAKVSRDLRVRGANFLARG
jgi:arsenite methyltransferase